MPYNYNRSIKPFSLQYLDKYCLSQLNNSSVASENVLSDIEL